MMKFSEWIDRHWNEIVVYGYCAILALVVIGGIACLIGHAVTIINSDIPTWLKWELLTR